MIRAMCLCENKTMRGAGFEPDHAGARRIQPFPLETTAQGNG
jgi:hypothetical protein